MLDQISTDVVFLLIDVSLKITLIWALAWLVLRTFRTMSVHSQHRIWTAVLLAFVVLPILTYAGPSLSVPIRIWPEESKNEIANSADSAGSLAAPRAQSADDRTIALREPMSRTNPPTMRSDPPTPSAFSDLSNSAEMTTASSVEQSTVNVPQHRSLDLGLSACAIACLIWLAGLLVMLVKFAIAVFQTRRIWRSSTVISDRSFPNELPVRECDQILCPVVVGFWRPCILLPRSWSDWNQAKRDAVFAHEIAHVRRGDTQLAVIVELVTVVFWFHPVCWWNKRKLSHLAELACDEAAAAAVGDRFAYARCLVEIAAANRGIAMLAAGVTMARTSEVSQRVRRLLDTRNPLTARASWLTMILILMLAAPVVTVVAALRPTSTNVDKQPPAAEDAKLRKNAVAKAEPAGQSNPATNAGERRRKKETNLPMMTMKGVVLRPDGTVAEDAVMERSTEPESEDVISASIVNGQFEIKTTASRTSMTEFLLRTPDSTLQAHLQIGGIAGHLLRQECTTPKQITLGPAKTIRVKVVAENDGVPNCHVKVNAGAHPYLGKTRADGVAELKIAQDDSVFMIAAWTDDHRIGGLHVSRKPTNELLGSDFQLEVTGGAPLRVRVVDEQKQPVPNVPLMFGSVTGQHGEIFIGHNPTSYQTTNAAGEAVFKWVPKWVNENSFINVARESGWRQISRNDQNSLPDGTRQLIIYPSRERVTVKGKIAGAKSDVSGLLVELWGTPNEEEGGLDYLRARCDAGGEFTARVLPGSRYCLFVDDIELVSNFWDGVIAPSLDAPVQTPELELLEAVPVEVRVTMGPDRRPMKNAWLRFETPHKFPGGRRFHGKTDERGRYSVPVAPGVLKVDASLGGWESEKTIHANQGQPAVVEFHRETVDKRLVTGKLVLPAGVTATIDKTTVMIAAMDGESTDEITIVSDATGRFSGEITADRISILATSPNEEFFGCGIVNVGAEGIEIPMEPTLRCEGKVVGPDDKPVAGMTVRMLARLTDLGRPGRPGRVNNFVDLFRDRIVVTDAKGGFVFTKTPRRMELSIFVSRPDAEQTSAYVERYFLPGDEPQVETIRLEPGDEKVSLETIFSNSLRDCRLAQIHALLVISGGGNGADSFIKSHITQVKDSLDAASFVPIVINGPESFRLRDRRRLFSVRQWPFPEENSIFLAAISTDGKELGRAVLNLNDEQAAASVAAFMKQHRPPRRDALADFEAALAEAKRTNRKVWACASQTRLEPCVKFSRWLDSQRELLSKDYVLFKFDHYLDTHGRDLASKLKFDGQGLPCYAILSSDGKALTSSVGPQGNIGDPSTSKEAAERLRQMLTTTARTLTGSEIDKLIESVRKQ